MIWVGNNPKIWVLLQRRKVDVHSKYNMKSHNRGQNSGSPSKYRQSMNVLSSELIRYSFSGQSEAPNLYRESVGSPYRTRNSLNIEMAEQLLRGIEN